MQNRKERERGLTIPIWRPRQPDTIQMEPLPRTAFHIASHHLAIADLIAITVSWLTLVLVFLVISLHRGPLVVHGGRRGSCRHQLLRRGAGAFLVRALDGRDGCFGRAAAGRAVRALRLVFGCGDGEGAGYWGRCFGGFAGCGVEGGGSFVRFRGGVGGFVVFAFDGFLEGFAVIAGCGFGFCLDSCFGGWVFVVLGGNLSFCFTPPCRARYIAGIEGVCRQAVRVGLFV